MKTFGLLLTMTACASLVGCEASMNLGGSSSKWEGQVDELLPVMGHRNFIVIADSAYPQQSNPGITTIYTGQTQLETVEQVIAMVEDASHVNPVIYVDQELASVTEADAPGIDAYRASLDGLLEDKPVQRLPHIEIIQKLDESAELFNVLILKTDLTLPYTSVFIELDCGYWDGDREQRLRDALGG